MEHGATIERSFARNVNMIRCIAFWVNIDLIGRASGKNQIAIDCQSPVQIARCKDAS